MEEVEEILRQLAHFGATLEWRRGKLLCHTLQERPLPISLQERIKNSKVRELASFASPTILVSGRVA